ncbi:hypothetical protein [Steroidobacter sp.]|uniref:hypothetical protein n=1 Tax=Steroidobacter sp. TaxID=1978227 RepID=UPI001A39B5BA|nr:hypothetical protein [Steroidobacter sp.]MBL8271869.1 hypothetical protein [Steroidobacter sp.]
MGTLRPFDIEIDRVAWHQLRTMSARGAEVPSALRALLDAPTGEDADKAYWRLENTVVVQGQLFEAAEAIVPVLLAAVLEQLPRHSMILALELLFQIVAGDADESEVALGNSDLGERCRIKAREGLSALYHVLIHERLSGAQEVLERIEVDQSRLDSAQAALARDPARE